MAIVWVSEETWLLLAWSVTAYRQAIARVVAEGEREREESQEDARREREHLKRAALVGSSSPVLSSPCTLALRLHLQLRVLRLTFSVAHNASQQMQAEAEEEADDRVRRMVATAEAKCEQRCTLEIARMQDDIARQVAEASRRTRHETERKAAEALRAADRAVLTARGLCELRRRDGPRLLP